MISRSLSDKSFIFNQLGTISFVYLSDVQKITHLHAFENLRYDLIANKSSYICISILIDFGVLQCSYVCTQITQYIPKL